MKLSGKRNPSSKVNHVEFQYSKIQQIFVRSKQSPISIAFKAKRYTPVRLVVKIPMQAIRDRRQ